MSLKVDWTCRSKMRDIITEKKKIDLISRKWKFVSPQKLTTQHKNVFL